MAFGVAWRALLVAMSTLASLTSLPLAPSFAAPASTATAFGTLVTSPSSAGIEANAGLHVAMMELNWATYEPHPGVFNVAYAAELRTSLSKLKSAGMSVTLGLG